MLKSATSTSFWRQYMRTRGAPFPFVVFRSIRGKILVRLPVPLVTPIIAFTVSPDIFVDRRDGDLRKFAFTVQSKDVKIWRIANWPMNDRNCEQVEVLLCNT
jgi:hypothetical protein